MVFPFKVYDIQSDQYIVSRRYGMFETIERIHGKRIGPSIEVPATDVDEDGFTAIDYVA